MKEVIALKEENGPLRIEPIVMLQALTQKTDQCAYLYEFGQDTYALSDGMAHALGLARQGTGLGTIWAQCVQACDRARIEQSLRRALAERQTTLWLEYQATDAHGHVRWFSERMTLHYHPQTGAPHLLVGSLRGMSQGGVTDSVTGLLMHNEFQRQFAQHQQSGAARWGTIMLLGIDDFTSLNTMKDHAFGDVVLHRTAQDIAQLLPDGMMIFRFDGDQFLVCGEKRDKGQLQELYESIRVHVGSSCEISDTPYHLTISAGVASYPQDGQTWSEVEKAASVALKHAKKQGRDRCVAFAPKMLQERMYEQSLRSALKASALGCFRGFRVVYQPVCHAQGLRVLGAEALLRFATVDGTEIGPATFIPVLEQMGLIHPVGLWVLEQAISQCKAWLAYAPDFVMNVNVSYLQLRRADFCDRVEALLAQYDLDAAHLILELTESCFITDAAHIDRSLKRLQAMHLRVAMDDFGTGYSSLGRLAQMDVDVVKIDRSFVRALHENKNNFDFVDAVVRLCHNAGMQVCIEGVESRQEQASVCLLSADYVQGFYIAKPMCAEDFFSRFLTDREVNAPLVVAPDPALLRDQLRGNQNVLFEMMESSPYAISFWARGLEFMASNARLRDLFGAGAEADLQRDFFRFSPKTQPDGQDSTKKAGEMMERAFAGERVDQFWLHRSQNGQEIPAEVQLVRIPYLDNYIVISYTRDMRDQRRMQQQIERFNTRLRAILDATPLCLNLWNQRFENTMCNQEAVKLFGLADEREYTEHFFELSPPYQPDGMASGDKALAKIKEAFAYGRTQFLWTHCNLEGKPIPSEITLVRIDDLGENGMPLVAGFTRDIRAQLTVQRTQEQASQRIRAVLDSMPLACLLWTLDREIVDCNQSAVHMFGARDKQEIMDDFDAFNPVRQPDGAYSIQKKEKKFQEAISRGLSIFEWAYSSKQGRIIPCEITLVKVTLSEEALIVAYSRDLRELYQTLELNERLTKLAYHDLLTGCASRIRFEEDLVERLQADADQVTALAIFDVDYFKTINDNYGHAMGDTVLKRVVKCVESLLPRGGMLGRFGGDEFMIQCQGLDRTHLHQLLERMVSAVAALRFEHEGIEFSVSISVGASFAMDGDQSYQQLLERADKALYEAKARGRDCSIIQ